MNHYKVASTLQYDMAPEDELRHAVGSIPLPSPRDFPEHHDSADLGDSVGDVA